MLRDLRSEETTRVVVINGIKYILVKSWHHLDNGDQYHFIHCYRGNNHVIPYKRWYWTVPKNG
jgi:hypothetical protein